MITLPDGLIFQIALDADLEPRGKGAKRTLRCPFHEDRHASAFLAAENVFHCSVCTPGSGLSAKDFCTALGRDWSAYVTSMTRRSEPESMLRRADTAPKPMFTAKDAELTWSLARTRARDDDKVEEDRPVYDYLATRGLLESWELGAFGVLGSEMRLPPAVRSWPSNGYRVIAPLYDSTGAITNVQARAIVPCEKKVVFPTGSVAKGTVFACSRGIELLRGENAGISTAIFAEGLTDYLALSFTSPVPVLASPGTSVAAHGIGPWVEGLDLILALDCDQAGESVISPTASAAFGFGAKSVQRLEWPAAANDACDVVKRLGAQGLEQFLIRALSAGAS